MRKINLLYVVLPLFVFVACARFEAPLGKPIPALSYHHLGAVKVSGGAVQVQNKAQRTSDGNLLASSFLSNPYDILSSYAAHRFYHNPSEQPRMLFQIYRADLQMVSSDPNLIEKLTFQEEETYQLNIDLALTPVSLKGIASPPYTINLERKLVLSENLSLSQKEFRQFEFIEKAMSDIDRGIIDIITNRIK